jgi:hypothetical protein
MISKVALPSRAAEVARHSLEPGLHVRQAIAYALAAAGDTLQAERELRLLISELDVSVSWQAEMATRAQLLLRKLADQSYVDQLAVWERQTIRDLGLHAFAELDHAAE